jgi:hypothetical protein
MQFRNLTFLTTAAVVLCVAGEPAIAQSANAKPAKTANGTWTAPHTADGQPDFQGVWGNNNATPLERPKELAGRAYLTEQEVTALKKKEAELFAGGSSDAAFGDQVFATVLANVKGTKDGFKSTDGGTGDYSSVWVLPRDWDNRTSLITDPADGRLPPLTKEAQQRQAASLASRNRLPAGPEDRGLSERCITFGSPRFGAAYQSYFQIVQSSKQLAIESETIHDTRIILLDGSPHLPASIQTWIGDSRGHWEGDTLVVDTANYKPNALMPAGFGGTSSAQLHVVERFTRTSPDILKWEITVEDPGTWSKPWSAMIPLRLSKQPLLEYACHEGNYGMQGILAGARAEEARGSK